MSTAPRPQTSSTPSSLRTSSPANGSRRQPVGVHRHDVGVTHQAQARRARVAAFEAGDERGPPGRRLPPLDRHARTLDVGLQDVGVARLVTRLGRAVVDTFVADQGLQQLDGRSGEVARHRPVLQLHETVTGSPSDAGSAVFTITPARRKVSMRLRVLAAAGSPRLHRSPSSLPRPRSTPPARLPTPGRVKDMAIQRDGKVVVAFQTAATDRFTLVRLQLDGSLDPTFGGDGIVETVVEPTRHSIIHDIALQPDGRIVAAGHVIEDVNDSKFALLRYRTDGSLDPTFSGDGKVITDFVTGNGLNPARRHRWRRVDRRRRIGDDVGGDSRLPLPGRRQPRHGLRRRSVRRSSTSRVRGTMPATSPSTRQATP